MVYNRDSHVEIGDSGRVGVVVKTFVEKVGLDVAYFTTAACEIEFGANSIAEVFPKLIFAEYANNRAERSVAVGVSFLVEFGESHKVGTQAKISADVKTSGRHFFGRRVLGYSAKGRNGCHENSNNSVVFHSCNVLKMHSCHAENGRGFEKIKAATQRGRRCCQEDNSE